MVYCTRNNMICYPIAPCQANISDIDHCNRLRIHPHALHPNNDLALHFDSAYKNRRNILYDVYEMKVCTIHIPERICNLR